MKNWGTNIIPENCWIDPSKQYTCDGKRVINLSIKLHNDVGDEVTYPVKGFVVVREKPFKTRFRIWSLDGRHDVVWNKSSHLNLIEVK